MSTHALYAFLFYFLHYMCTVEFKELSQYYLTFDQGCGIKSPLRSLVFWPGVDSNSGHIPLLDYTSSLVLCRFTWCTVLARHATWMSFHDATLLHSKSQSRSCKFSNPGVSRIPTKNKGSVYTTHQPHRLHHPCTGCIVSHALAPYSQKHLSDMMLDENPTFLTLQTLILHVK